MRCASLASLPPSASGSFLYPVFPPPPSPSVANPTCRPWRGSKARCCVHTVNSTTVQNVSFTTTTIVGSVSVGGGDREREGQRRQAVHRLVVPCRAPCQDAGLWLCGGKSARETLSCVGRHTECWSEIGIWGRGTRRSRANVFPLNCSNAHAIQLAGGGTGEGSSSSRLISHSQTNWGPSSRALLLFVTVCPRGSSVSVRVPSPIANSGCNTKCFAT